MVPHFFELPPLRQAVWGLCPSAPFVAGTDEYVIGGAKPLSKSALNRYWEKYTKALGFGHAEKQGDPWRPSIDRHQIRHEYATMLYEAGVDVLAAQTIMGHTDIATTQRIYTHVRESRIENARNLLESAFGLNDSLNTSGT